MFTDLENRANRFLEQHRPAITALDYLGVNLDDPTVKTSNIVVTYPPKQVLHDVSAEDFTPPVSTQPKALYVHVPFCTGICNYCAFERTAKSENDPQIPAYVDLLSRESALVREKQGGEKIPVESIYIGGGTPTLLTPAYLRQLLEIIARDYDLKPGGEYTLEGSPETITEGGVEKLAIAKQYGVNRVSIGVESFDDRTLKSLNRRHNARDAENVIDIIRQAGIPNIDFDLIRGLPESDADHIINDLTHIATLRPPSVTSYQYVKKAGSPNFKQKDKERHPDSLLHHAMFMEGMKELGYAHADPIMDCYTVGRDAVYQHNLQKWREAYDLISLGQGAYGNIGNTQYINFADPKQYRAALFAGKLPVEKASKLSPEEKMRRDFVLGLRAGIDRAAFRRRNGIDVMQTPFAHIIRDIIKAGGLVETPDEIKLSEVGQLFTSSIQMKFYSINVLLACGELQTLGLKKLRR